MSQRIDLLDIDFDERLLTDPEESLVNLETKMPKNLLESDNGTVDIRIDNILGKSNPPIMKKYGSLQMINPQVRLTMISQRSKGKSS